MPIIKSAIKKMRQDAARRQLNQARISELRTVVKKATTSKKFADISAAYSALDRAVKKNLIHRNFAARHKAQLGKLTKPVKLEKGTKPKKSPTKATKKAPVKRSAKK